MPTGRYSDQDVEHYDRPRRRTRPRTKERPTYDDAAAAERPGLHRVDQTAIHQQREPATVDGHHDPVGCVLVGRPLLGAGPGPAPGTLVVLHVLVGVPPRGHQNNPDQTEAKSGKVLPVVATSSTRTPSTVAPTITAAWAIRWSA